MFRRAIIPLARSNIQVLSTRNIQCKNVDLGKVRLPKVDKTLQAATESLAARGFLRPSKPYDPPADIEQTVLRICADNGLNSNSEFEGLDVKYVILNACYQATGHSVPNSLLYTIECVDDLVQFYHQPVDVKTPFDALKKMDLPKNMHVQHEYVRFHPDKDTLFNGKSAFPKSSTIVSGLTTKKKYEGYTAKRSWP